MLWVPKRTVSMILKLNLVDYLGIQVDKPWYNILLIVLFACKCIKNHICKVTGKYELYFRASIYVFDVFLPLSDK